MKKRLYQDYVFDMLDSIRDIQEFTKGMNYHDFVNDKKTVNAVIRSLEIIGEAVKKIPYHIRKKYPSIPWKKISGMRDKLIHEYFGVDTEIIWVVVTEEIHSLKTDLEKVLKDMEREEK